MPETKGYTFHDAGKKLGEEYDSPVVEKDRVFYPSFSLDANKIPELKNAQVGKPIQLVIKGVVKRKAVNESNDRNSFTVDVEVRSVGVSNPKSKKFSKDVIDSYAKGEK